jgi:hypothetical protein
MFGAGAAGYCQWRRSLNAWAAVGAVQAAVPAPHDDVQNSQWGDLLGQYRLGVKLVKLVVQFVVVLVQLGV